MNSKNSIPTLAYISPDCFFDVDFPILPELNKQYNLIWFPIIPEKGSRYSPSQIKMYANEHNINYVLHIRKGKRRHPKQLPFSYRLLKKIKQTDADIIYTEYLSDIYIAALAMLMCSPKKTIYAIHDVVSHTSFNSAVSVWLNKQMNNHFKYFHIFSQNQKSIFDTMYPNKQSFYAPLALKDFGISNLKRPKKEPCKFLFFGAIMEYKGLDLLIQACEALVTEGTTEFILTIAGKGAYWDKVKHHIKNKQYFKTHIEFIPDSEIPNLFNSHHFLILPYLDVTQSGPQMIALNYNLPIIASNHEGFKEYIDNEHNGFLFQNRSLEALIQVLKKSIALSQSQYDTIVSNLIKKKNSTYLLPEIIAHYENMFNTVYKNNI